MNASTSAIADSTWAREAWKRYKVDPALRQYIDKYVAVFGARVIASGDDFSAVLEEAQKLTGVLSEDAILIDYWGNDGTFHESLEE